MWVATVVTTSSLRLIAISEWSRKFVMFSRNYLISEAHCNFNAKWFSWGYDVVTTSSLRLIAINARTANGNSVGRNYLISEAHCNRQDALFAIPVSRNYLISEAHCNLEFWRHRKVVGVVTTSSLRLIAIWLCTPWKTVKKVVTTSSLRLIAIYMWVASFFLGLS